MQLLQSRALPLGYPAVEGALNIVEFGSGASTLSISASYGAAAGGGKGTTIEVKGGT